MSEHDEIRDLLSLAAAGALSAEEEGRVARHLRECTACSAELEGWQALAAGLRRLPTPQPPAALLERVRASVEWQFAAEAEQRWNRGVLAFTLLFAWTVTLASWPIFRLVSGDMLGWLAPGFGKLWLGLVGYTVVAWLTGGVAAATLAYSRRRERRVA
jgi:anti-sigma factor RsiW